MGVYSGNRTLLGESMEVDNMGHALDFVIECERNELKLFDAVISCDMIGAYTEAGLATLVKEDVDNAKEESGKSLGQKIKGLWEKAVAAVKRFVSTFIAKVQNLFSNDAKLIKEYGKNFAENGSGYVLKFDWRKPNYKSFDTPERVIGLQDIDSCYNGVFANIGKADSTDAIDKEVERLKKEAKEYDVYKKSEDLLFTSEKATEKYTLDSNDVREILRIMGGSSRTINSVKRAGNFVIKELKEKQSHIKSATKVAEGDLTLAKLNAQYKIGSIYIKAAQKRLNAVLSGMTRILATCRKVFVAVGKNATGKSTNESALYDNVLAEGSDIYVMKALDMTM